MKKFILIALLAVCASNSSLFGQTVRSEYLPYTQAFVEIGGTYNQALGGFANKFNDGNSGFAGGGGGMTYGFNVQRQGTRFNIGVAFEFQVNWFKVDHDTLGLFLDQAYEHPDARGTELILDRRSWAVPFTAIGPVAGVWLGNVLFEAQFLVGRIRPGNPNYIIDQGNYIAPGWGKFFYDKDNRSASSRRNWDFAFQPKAALVFPFLDVHGFKIHASYLQGRINQEMEVINTVVPPTGGIAFQRSQQSFSQDIRAWSIGAGLVLGL